MILTGFEWSAVFVILLYSAFATFLYHHIATVIFRLRKAETQRAKWISTTVFFTVYAAAYSATFLAPLYLTGTFWQGLAATLHLIAQIGSLAVLYIILKKILQLWAWLKNKRNS